MKECHKKKIVKRLMVKHVAQNMGCDGSVVKQASRVIHASY